MTKEVQLCTNGRTATVFKPNAGDLKVALSSHGDEQGVTEMLPSL